MFPVVLVRVGVCTNVNENTRALFRRFNNEIRVIFFILDGLHYLPHLDFEKSEKRNNNNNKNNNKKDLIPRKLIVMKISITAHYTLM